MEYSTVVSTGFARFGSPFLTPSTSLALLSYRLALVLRPHALERQHAHPAFRDVADAVIHLSHHLPHEHSPEAHDVEFALHTGPRILTAKTTAATAGWAWTAARRSACLPIRSCRAVVMTSPYVSDGSHRASTHDA